MFNRSQNDEWELRPVYVSEGKMPLTILVATLFLLTASFHLAHATCLRRFYEAELAQCRTPTRWLEYFVSAPLQIVLIAYSLGVRGRLVLLAVAALVAATIPHGYLVERGARPASPDRWATPLADRLVPWALGFLPLAAAWGLILSTFYDSLFDPTERAPAFVHVILWGELVLFVSFGGAAFYAQYGPPRYFYRGEIVFQVLSLVSKGLLGVLLLINVLMLSSFDEAYL